MKRLEHTTMEKHMMAKHQLSVPFGLLMASAVLFVLLMQIPAIADSSSTVKKRTILDDVDMFIKTYYSEFCIDTTGSEPTIALLLYTPCDTLFLDSIGHFRGRKTGWFPGSFVGFEIPISRLHILAEREGIRWSYSRQVRIPEHNWTRPRFGSIFIEPCPDLQEWLPFSLTIHKMDSSCIRVRAITPGSDSDTMDIIRLENTGQTQVIMDTLLPGFYTCTFKRDTVRVLPNHLDTTRGAVFACSKVVVDSILVEPGFRTIIEPCVVFGLQPYEYIGELTGPCHFIYHGKMEKIDDPRFTY